MEKIIKEMLKNIFPYNLCLEYEYKRRILNENRID